MLHVIIKFLTFSPENVSVEIYWALGAIYFLFYVTTCLSILSNKLGFRSRLAWILLSTVLPVVGMAFYCLRCLAIADYQFLKQFGLAPKPKV